MIANTFCMFFFLFVNFVLVKISSFYFHYEKGLYYTINIFKSNFYMKKINNKLQNEIVFVACPYHQATKSFLFNNIFNQQNSSNFFVTKLNCFYFMKIPEVLMACVEEMPQEINYECFKSGIPQISYSVPGFLYQKGYKLGRTIGEGSYCKVKMAIKLFCDGHARKLACKVISKNKASKDFVTKFLPRELHILQHLHHPNIIQVFDIFESTEAVFIFTNYCDKGDLLDYIKKRGALHEYKAKLFFRQLVSAIHYLHKQDIAHRDLKCENIFITASETLVIGDFGFARSCRDLKSKKRILSETFCGSAAYAAPEILQGIPYNPKMYDLWSLGCVLYIMLTGTMPFDDTDTKQMLRQQIRQNFEIRNFHLSNNAEKLIYHMLEPDVTRRATISQVSLSYWLNERLTPNGFLSIHPVAFGSH